MMAGWIFTLFALLFVGVGGFALVMMMRGKLHATAAAPVRREVVPDGEALHLPLAAGLPGSKGCPGSAGPAATSSPDWCCIRMSWNTA